MMTTQDYIVLANALHEQMQDVNHRDYRSGDRPIDYKIASAKRDGARVTFWRVVQSIIDALKADNPKFDENAFRAHISSSVL